MQDKIISFLIVNVPYMRHNVKYFNHKICILLSAFSRKDYLVDCLTYLTTNLPSNNLAIILSILSLSVSAITEMTLLLPQCLMCLKGFQIKQMMVDLFWFPPLIKTRKKMAHVTKDVTLLSRSYSIRMKLTLKGRCLVLSQLYKLLILKLSPHVIY